MNSEENNRKGREVLIKLLKAGETVDVPASGLSMFPVLLPFDVLRVRPVNVGSLKRGQIIVFVQGDRIISHRYIRTDQDRVISKGDGLIRFDLPVKAEAVLGVVIARTRNDKTLGLETKKYVILGRIMSYVTPLTGYFFYYLGRAWHKWIFNKKW